jgi:hypothetical protein
MGKMGSLGIGGTVVATQSSGAGGSFVATYDIPTNLQGRGRIAIRLQSPTSGYYAFNWFYNNTTGASGNNGNSGSGGIPAGTIPTFKIVSVDQDNTVTIKTNNFPANDKFTVTMGKMGTLGIGGVVVDTQASGKGGTFKATYDIPDSLKGLNRIAIRLQSSSSGYYAYNWFYNNSTSNGNNGGGASGTGGLPAGTIPTFYIDSVLRNNTVTITTYNFPANDNFTVTMGPMGTLGIGGIVVDSQTSGAGGSFTATYTIPGELHGNRRISIRLQSATSGYYSYNWFYNTTTP